MTTRHEKYITTDMTVDWPWTITADGVQVRSNDREAIVWYCDQHLAGKFVTIAYYANDGRIITEFCGDWLGADAADHAEFVRGGYLDLKACRFVTDFDDFKSGALGIAATDRYKYVTDLLDRVEFLLGGG